MSEYVGRKKGKHQWRCCCRCGSEKTVSSSNLRKNSSCGCSRHSRLLGKRFDRLLVVSRDKTKRKNQDRDTCWICLCDCGREIRTKGKNLLAENTRSCGCIKNPDLTGKQFGRLTVVSRAEMKRNANGSTSSRWICLCSCGVEVVVRGTELKRGDTKSCGCYRKQVTRQRCRTHGKSHTREYRAMKCRRYSETKQRIDVMWSLQMEEALREQQPACVLCNSNEYLSVDHVRPLSDGYGLYPGNAVTLCRSCNSSKGAKHVENLAKSDRAKLFKAAKEFAAYWQSEG